MFGLSDEQFNDFTVWLNCTYIVSKGRERHGKKYINVIDRPKRLILGTKKYYDWAYEKIQQFKDINQTK